jgi:hypothetical protein
VLQASAVKGNDEMKRQYVNNIDAISITLALLAFACVLGIDFFHGSGHLFHVFTAGFFFFGGLGAFYNGFRKVWQAQTEQRQVDWYKQPLILAGIALSLAAFHDIIEYILNPIFPAASGPLSVCNNILEAIALFLFATAAYFWLRERW